MSDSLSLNAQTSALLLMDYQGLVLDNFLAPNAAARAVNNASALLSSARAAELLTIHVNVGFRSGYPEISSRNKLFSMLKESGMLAPGRDSMNIHASLSPKSSEPVVIKHRIGAFSGTDLDFILRAQGIETLILAGVTTSGVVLSTARQAFDLDYQLVVASDACADVEEQIHALLVEKVLRQQAAVVLSEDIQSLLS